MTAEVLMTKGKRSNNEAVQLAQTFKITYECEDWMDAADILEKIQEAYEDHGYTCVKVVQEL